MAEDGDGADPLDAVWEEITTLQTKVSQLKERVDDSAGTTASPEMAIRGRMPATVQSLQDGRVVLDINPHQRVTQPNEDVLAELEPGTQVSVTESGGIANVLDEPTADAAVTSMEVTDSPNVSYDDIGGLDDVIRTVEEGVQFPLTRRELFTEIGIDPPSGVLLVGPPGTGKTLLAKAVANHSNATFLGLSGSEVISKWVGQSANRIRQLFELADSKSPSVIFIDEIDTIASERTTTDSAGENEVQRATNQLLAEMDGFADRDDVQILAATNRPEILDPAITRPGRFDMTVTVGEPDRAAREEIFEIHTAQIDLDDEIDITELAEKTTDLTGAEIEGLCTQAGISAIRAGRTVVRQEDFRDVLDELDQ